MLTFGINDVSVDDFSARTAAVEVTACQPRFKGEQFRHGISAHATDAVNHEGVRRLAVASGGTSDHWTEAGPADVEIVDHLYWQGGWRAVRVPCTGD